MNTTILMMIALTVCGLIAGALLQSLVAANRVNQLKAQIDNSIPVKDLLYFLHDRVQPRYMKDSTSWNAAIYDVEKWVKSWDE